MIASGAVQVAPLISRIVPMDEIASVITAPAAPGDIRVLGVPQ
jgi:hypothetical protein